MRSQPVRKPSLPLNPAPWEIRALIGRHHGKNVSAQDLRYIQNHEALRILTGYEQPITVQIEGRRGRSLQYSRPSDSSTQTERPRDNAASDRQCYSHITLPGRNHGDGGRYEYLPNTPLGYLPLHHELDSGLGWTDGSFHQGELSGLETEEGLDECHTHQGGRAARVRGGSPSSESFISSELSDSGFYSVSTAEFLHFQRLLEKRMRMYNSRLHHQGELQNLCMDTQKAHRELEAIPEALTMQPDSECVETEAYPHQMVRVASMQLRKNERPNLNRHSSSSAAIFSTCSSPSGQQSLTPCATTAAGMLRRSRTLHHRPVPVEQRRRASHPTSPNYCSMTLNRYRHATNQDHAHTTLSARDTHQGYTHTMLPLHGTHRGDAYPMLPPHAPRQTHATLPTQQAHHILRTRPKHAISQPSLSSSTDDHHFAPPQEPWHHDNRGRSFTEPPTVVKVECGKETSGERERGRYHTLSHTPSQEGNDTWPKTTNRHGPYSTLEGHMTTTTLSASKPPVGPSNPRAMRNQLLRERALRVADERSGGISTDDETNVEIRRVGRYWSRSERREQVLQKQRQKREALRGGGANSNTSVGGDSSGYSALMELSQRKLSRLRNRKLLDDWTTVEELLTHGTRLGTHDENIQIPNSLLTVTTV
ncbi:hypothetical protein HF521_008861 [Silurus meridionalis]|uniref:Uncharacterized protein n=1 Tax=Silurus meridionalis TaxID=175797 RepID=A0A8T0ALB8_SILME|nr:hypothetical protein HF521_008861 [Silurus meridionalis]